MSNTKRIIKNTIILYIRMIIVLLISLYTSRVVLHALGIDDFGLFNVVGGVVGLLTFFNGTMTKSTQKFLNVAMVNEKESLTGIFASSITVHILFAILFLVIGETIGLWFLNCKVNIPENRLFAANIVYHATIVSFCISILTIPYNAAVIAYEKMTFMAIVSILDAFLKLAIAIILLNVYSDRLIIYGVLLLFITISNFLLYYLYCRKCYSLLKFKISYNKYNFKRIFEYVSWTLVGQFAVVGCNQGNVVLVNMFHSLAANAAMTVGSQVNNAIIGLTTNFQTAFNPQITKSYAEGNYDDLKSLIYMTSKMSFFIMFIVVIPIAFNIDFLLELWLGTVPQFANTFAILFMINGIINAISIPYNFTVLSSDNIRNFQLATAVVFLCDLPIAYILFIIGMPATTVLWVKICIISVMFFVRVFYASKVVESINLFDVCREELVPVLFTAGISVLLACYLNDICYNLHLRLVFTVIIEVVSLALFYLLCLSSKERISLLTVLKNNIKKYVAKE